ncbi:MAG: HlyD family efflux transporter periplasmic adaptor subunit [Planctomycetes bacterium]|nr:HlyD family efflux transporter periplasmic adaptor subunit [Planctomycetota bacterium]
MSEELEQRPSHAPSRDRAVFGTHAHEFFSRPPHWLLRSGMTLLGAVLALFLLFGTIIKYPDMITARATITGSTPVIEIVARQNGNLESLRVQEGEKVVANQVIAVVQSTARSEAVLALSARLAAVATCFADETAPEPAAFAPVENLGSLQESYADFVNAWSHWREQLADDRELRPEEWLRQPQGGKVTEADSLRMQLEASRRELEIGREKFAQMSALRSSDSISRISYRDEELRLLGLVRSHAVIEQTLTETLRLAREAARSKFNKLRGEIDAWDSDYVLRAPAPGRVAFYDFWSEQQFVTAGRQVFLILPETNALICRMSVSDGGAGKIQAGQRVLIKLDDYPYKEFGTVTGTVQSVSSVARSGANMVLIGVPTPLVTSFGKEIGFRQDMAGEASIVTEDIRLIGRILYEIRRAFVNNS